MKKGKKGKKRENLEERHKMDNVFFLLFLVKVSEILKKSSGQQWGVLVNAEVLLPKVSQESQKEKNPKRESRKFGFRVNYSLIQGEIRLINANQRKREDSDSNMKGQMYKIWSKNKNQTEKEKRHRVDHYRLNTFSLYKMGVGVLVVVIATI